MDKGLYIAVFYLPQQQRISVGQLAQFVFNRGYYFYVGSAQKNLSARLERHSKKKKPLRWHIDYLSVKTDMLGAVVIPKSKAYECKIAKKLGNLFKRPVDVFGASDCSCPGHLFYVKDLAKI